MNAINPFKQILRFSLIAVMLILAFAGCEIINSDEPAFTEFSFNGQKGKAKISASKRTIEVEAQDTTRIYAVVVIFKVTPEGTSVEVGKKKQVSGETPQDFTEPVEYQLTSPDGSARSTWKVTVKSSGNKAVARPLKSGKVKYEIFDTQKGKVVKSNYYFCWDDYGYKQRIEEIEHVREDLKIHSVTILDKRAGKLISGYKDDEGREEWNEFGGYEIISNQYFEDCRGLSPWWCYGVNENVEIYIKLGQMSSSTKSIGGKQCDVYTWLSNTSSPFGGKTLAVWGNTVFMADGDDVHFRYTAIEAADAAPSGAFSKTFDVW